MDSLSPEVLHEIARQLDFAGLAAFRRAGTKYAAVGTEHLAKTVRFHCSQASLDRLKLFITHPVLRHKITSLKYEGNLLRDIGCIHGFFSLHESGHYDAGRPREPVKDCSNRERRLYERNRAKWGSEIETKYEAYTGAYETQQSLLESRAYRDVLSSCQRAFTNLENVILSTTGRCKHIVSRRYFEEFPFGCDLPLLESSSHSIQSLSSVILSPISAGSAAGSTLPRLRNLTVSVLTPSFFAGGRLSKIKNVFKSLKRLELTFRSDAEILGPLYMDEQYWHCGIREGYLREALMAATELEHLRINFQGVSFDDHPRLDVILGNHVWPKLNWIDIDHVDVSDEYFLSVLRRHPSLQSVWIGYMTLTTGSWYDLTMKLSQDFALRTFYPVGILEDPTAVYFADHIDVDIYKDEGESWTLGTALDMFVCDMDDMEDGYHPMTWCEWQDEYELKAELEVSDDEMSMSDGSHTDCY